MITSLVPDLMMRPNVYWVSDGLKKSMITYLQNEDKKKDSVISLVWEALVTKSYEEHCMYSSFVSLSESWIWTITGRSDPHFLDFVCDIARDGQGVA